MFGGENMSEDYINQMQFLTEMADYQISAHEFFSRVLLESLNRHFDLRHIVLFFFDSDNHFLSWKTFDSIVMDSDQHPYHLFQNEDVVRQEIYKNAKGYHQDFNHFEVKGYLSSKLVNGDYDHSSYVRFISEQFSGYYSINYAFGINGYIQLSCFKTKEEGDFTEKEIENFNTIYMYVANAYRNFKKYAHSKILLNILNEVVNREVKAYLIVDDDMNIMQYNDQALEAIREILGSLAVQEIQQENHCQWLPSLLSGQNEKINDEQPSVSYIKNYQVNVYSHNELYPCGIVEKFYWMSLVKMDNKKTIAQGSFDHLTPMEQKVIRLMYEGKTYQSIADELVVSYHTVKNHVQNIYHKCNVTSRYELYKWMENNMQ